MRELRQRADLPTPRVNGALRAAHGQPRPSKRRLPRKGFEAWRWASWGPIFLNFLLVLTAIGIASGVNHSGNPERHATPLGRREEGGWTPCSAKDRAASRSFSS